MKDFFSTNQWGHSTLSSQPPLTLLQPPGADPHSAVMRDRVQSNLTELYPDDKQGERLYFSSTRFIFLALFYGYVSITERFQEGDNRSLFSGRQAQITQLRRIYIIRYFRCRPAICG